MVIVGSGKRTPIFVFLVVRSSCQPLQVCDAVLWLQAFTAVMLASVTRYVVWDGMTKGSSRQVCLQ